ncbi:MAG: hypothetical protein HYW77_01335 [Parcubacteria group bacterium]|nr:hypothetical protein [Parcubacteria group bacterium]
MFIIFPLILILGSIVAIFAIVWRKRIYLRKLDALEFENGISFWVSMYPELNEVFNKVQLSKYKDHLLTELEKALRRLRIVSLKIENKVSHWLERMPKVLESTAVETNTGNGTTKETTLVNLVVNGDDWKKQEQEFVMEIAKSPKNAQLYRKLGALYMKQKLWEDALESLKTAVNLDPEDLESKARLEKVVQKVSL